MAERKEGKLQASMGNSKPSGRPLRAAAQTKTYKEQSDSDHQSSQSESEKPPPPKACVFHLFLHCLGYNSLFYSQDLHHYPVSLSSKQKKALGRPAKIVPGPTTGRGQKTETSSWAKEQSKISEKKEADKTSAQIQTNDSSRKDHSPAHQTVKKTPFAQGSAKGHKGSWMARLSSMFASPPSIERMRCKKNLTAVKEKFALGVHMNIDNLSSFYSR